MNAVMSHGEDQLSTEALVHARKVARWMVQGILPSPEHAARATRTIEAFAKSELAHDAGLHFDDARRILQAGSMGVLPSQALCVETSEQIEEALDYVRNGMHTADAMRGRFMGMRAS